MRWKRRSRRDEVQGALRTLLACRLTDAPAAAATQARLALRLALGGTTATLAELPPILSEQEHLGQEQRPGLGTKRELQQDRLSWFCAALCEYLDERVCALVATLEGRVGFAGLAQVRAEAYSARIVALLGAIERQVAALADPFSHDQAETEFLERYRRQARQRHGFLFPAGL